MSKHVIIFENVWDNNPEYRTTVERDAAVAKAANVEKKLEETEEELFGLYAKFADVRRERDALKVRVESLEKELEAVATGRPRGKATRERFAELEAKAVDARREASESEENWALVTKQRDRLQRRLNGFLRGLEAMNNVAIAAGFLPRATDDDGYLRFDEGGGF